VAERTSTDAGWLTAAIFVNPASFAQAFAEQKLCPRDKENCRPGQGKVFLEWPIFSFIVTGTGSMG